MTGLVGPNGVGKTTLLSLAVGMIRPTAGTVRVAGETAGSRAARDLTAFVAQDAPLYQNLPVRDMLRVGRNLNVRWDQDRAVSRLDGLGIPLKQRVGALSGGQKAQLALTIALARRPELLVLDEPLAALDPLARADFMQSVREAVAADQISAVFSTHVVAELDQVADYLIVLGRGEVLLSGTTADLTAAHGGRSDPEQVILSALRENARSRAQEVAAMTAAAIPGRRERPAARPVPWTRLAWVTWRQHRAALAGAAALLGVIAAYLAFTGHEIHRAYDAFVAAGCPQAALCRGPACRSRPPLPVADPGASCPFTAPERAGGGVRDQRAVGPVPAAGRPGAARRVRRRAGAGP